jgi:hypothetical protein
MVSMVQVCVVLAQTCNLPAHVSHQYLMGRLLQVLQAHVTILVT